MTLSSPAAAGSGGAPDAAAAPAAPADDGADPFPLVSAGTPAAAALWTNAIRDVPMTELHDNSGLSEAEMAAERAAWDAANEGARLTGTDPVVPTDAMAFFRARAGTWASWRVTHHLAFRRSETGESAIKMVVLPPTDERIVSLCADNDVGADEEVVGGCHVTWQATMAWDAEGENHAGETVFALVPEKGSNGARGRMLRDRGYAEIVPIAGTYFMDAAGGLNLITPYDGGEVVERFVFDGPDMVHRASTVCRFGGMGTATFSTERRMECTPPVADVAFDHDMLVQGGPGLSPDDRSLDGSEGGAGSGSSVGGKTFQSRLGAATAARAAAASGGKPSARSAFATGFGSTEARPAAGAAAAEPAGAADPVAAAAEKVGIDLSKVPPSMRADFIASLNREIGRAHV